MEKLEYGVGTESKNLSIIFALYGFSDVYLVFYKWNRITLDCSRKMIFFTKTDKERSIDHLTQRCLSASHSRHHQTEQNSFVNYIPVILLSMIFDGGNAKL